MGVLYALIGLAMRHGAARLARCAMEEGWHGSDSGQRSLAACREHRTACHAAGGAALWGEHAAMAECPFSHTRALTQTCLLPPSGRRFKRRPRLGGGSALSKLGGE